MRKELFLLKNFINEHLYQMHDEIIDKILIKGNTMELIFSNLHFKNYNGDFCSARIIFENLENIKYDVYADIYKCNRLLIESGETLYIFDFVRYMEQNKILLEVVDILFGYNLIEIKGEMIINKRYEKKFQMFISTKDITYIFT